MLIDAGGVVIDSAAPVREFDRYVSAAVAPAKRQERWTASAWRWRRI
jgi:hypothetical protein